MSQPLQFETGTVAALLRDTLVTLDQGLERVPEAWLQRPLANGAWSISRNVAHLAIYEELLAAPALEELARGGDGMAVVPEVPRTRADFDRIEADLQQRLDEAAPAFAKLANGRPRWSNASIRSSSIGPPVCSGLKAEV